MRRQALAWRRALRRAGPLVRRHDREVWPNGPIIGILPSGTPLTALAFNGDWAFVQNWGGIGWVYLPYLACGPLYY